MKSNYLEMTLPELYVIASQRGVTNFIGKNEEEVANILSDLDGDSEVQTEKLKKSVSDSVAEKPANLPTKKVKSLSKKNRGFKALEDNDIDEDIDSYIDISEFDDDNIGETATERVTNRLNDVTVEDDEEEFIDASFDDDSDEDDKLKTKHKEKLMAKAKAVTSKKATKGSSVAKKSTKKVDSKVLGDKAPYQEGTAGFCAFIALKKGGTLDTIVSNADKLIEKFGAKPPKSTAQKIKIIMAEINAGKKGDKWGKFTLNEKTGKISNVN